jgi:predicted DCC family thiol-disulfide oxidoreductase YuxK
MIPIDMARDPTRSAAADRSDPAGSTAVYEDDPAGSAAADQRARWTVLYGADCGFCRWSLAQVLALDRGRRLRPVALGSEESDRLLADLSPNAQAASWHLVAPDGRRESAGAAGVVLLSLLPGGGAPAALLRRAPRVTELAYRWVADHRSLLSKAIPNRAKERATVQIERHVPAVGIDRGAATVRDRTPPSADGRTAA